MRGQGQLVGWVGAHELSAMGRESQDPGSAGLLACLVGQFDPAPRALLLGAWREGAFTCSLAGRVVKSVDR